MCSAQRYNENESLLTQKKTEKWSLHFQTVEKRYKDLGWQSYKKSGTVALR